MEIPEMTPFAIGAVYAEYCEWLHLTRCGGSFLLPVG
jgi:hypothetical protein